MAIKSVHVMVGEQHERRCYGCTIEELKEANSLHSWKSPDSLMLLSASIQSDCQEVLAMAEEDPDPSKAFETVRQYLNRSKYCLAEASRLMRVKEAV